MRGMKRDEEEPEFSSPALFSLISCSLFVLAEKKPIKTG
jgi:hypothetical protein